MSNPSRAAHAPRILVALAVLVLSGGCGSSKAYPVHGKVIIFGVGPLTEGEVRFRPVSKPDRIAVGRVQKDGSFSLATPGHGEGALEGACKVAVVVEPRKGKPVIDERFANFDTADLQFTVTARTPPNQNYFTIEVTRPGR
jgi:hypothetical protein